MNKKYILIFISSLSIIMLILVSYSYFESKYNYLEYSSIPTYGGGAIMSLAIDPSSPNILYAASDLSGPYKSEDFGNSWKSIRTGLRSEGDWDTATITINPKNHNQIFIGSGQVFGHYNGNYGGLFRSDDSGNTWKLVSRKLKFSGHGDLRQSDSLILFDINNNSIMYAATIWDGIFKSIDGGKNWFYDGLSGLYLTSIAMNKDGIIFASALERDNRSGGIFKSENGDIWEKLSNFSTKKLVVNGRTIYAIIPGLGMYKSIDEGKSWIIKNNGISIASINSLSGLTIDQINPNILYMVSYTWKNQLKSLYRTINGGDSWENIPEGKSNISVINLWNPSGSWFSSGSNSIIVDPTNSSRIYLEDAYTVWKSNDNSKSWSTNAQGLETTVTDIIKSHPSIPGFIIIGIRDVAGIISKNGGKTTKNLWDWRKGNISDSNIWSIDYIDTDTNISNATIYIATGNNGIGNLWKSIDGGITWNVLPNLPSSGEKKSVVVDQSNPKIIYVSVKNNGIYKSTDYGYSWTHLTNGLPTNSVIKKIIIDPINTSNLYILDIRNGIYKSKNGGLNWKKSNKGIDPGLGQLNNFNCLAIDPNHLNILYAGGQYYGLYKSIDYADNWTMIFSNFSCGDVFVSKINSVVYSGGMAEWWYESQKGLFASNDGGINWKSIGDLVNDIPLPYIKSIDEDPFNPGILYIGTEGGGNYKIRYYNLIKNFKNH